MAITQNYDDKSDSPVVGIKPSSGELVDTISRGSLSLSEPKGASTGNHDINKGFSRVVKRFKQRSNRAKNNALDNLSDIDDAEVIGYLNTKEEMHYKRMLWEAIYGKYVNAKKQKRTAERKKVAPLKKASKTTEKVKSPRRSSRINYDALKLLDEELEHGSKASQSQIIPSDSRTLKSDNTPSVIMHGSNEDTEMSCDEEIETSGHHSCELYGQYGDEHYSGDFYDQYGDEHHIDDCFVFN